MARIEEYLLENRIVLAIVGATASGKTDFGISLAKQFNSEIISADSRQIYKYLDIGSAKPSREELLSVKHHFIDCIAPDEDFSAGDFAQMGGKIINSLFDAQKVPIIVGGTGLYISALCDGFFKEPDGADYSNIRIELEKSLEENGKDYLYNELKRIEPNISSFYDDKNPRRLIRALEYYYVHGETLSSAQEKYLIKPNFKTIYLRLDWNREELYERINRRSEIMWNGGLIEETKSILDMGYSRKLNSLNTIGYKEALLYLDGKMSSPEALDLLRQKTRNYAKRQITWFKRLKNAISLDGKSPNIDGKQTSIAEIINIIA